MDLHHGTGEETVRFSRTETRSGGSDLIVTIFDGDKAPYNITLRAGGGPTMSFGRRDGNDIVFDTDYFGNKRSDIIPGPFADLNLDGINVVL